MEREDAPGPPSQGHGPGPEAGAVETGKWAKTDNRFVCNNACNYDICLYSAWLTDRGAEALACKAHGEGQREECYADHNSRGGELLSDCRCSLSVSINKTTGMDG